MSGDDAAAAEEARVLEVTAALTKSMRQMNEVLQTLNQQAVELSQDLGTAERQLNALYLPFQTAIYSLQTAGSRPTRS